jgi:hypothetical protein
VCTLETKFVSSTKLYITVNTLYNGDNKYNNKIRIIIIIIIIQKVPERRVCKARHQDTINHSYWPHRTYFGSAGVEIQRLIMVSSITGIVSCNYRISATLYTIETWFILGTQF